MNIRPGSLIRFLDKTSEWSVYLMILVLPFSKSLLEILFVVALISVLLRKSIVKESLFEFNTTNIILALFLAASLVSLINSGNLPLSIRAFFAKTLKFAVLYLLVQDILRGRVTMKNFLNMAFISCVVILIDAFIQYFITHVDLLHSYPSFQFSQPTLLSFENCPYPSGFLGFPTASFPFPNDFSAWILIFIFPVGAAAFYRGKPVWRRLVLAATLLVLSFFLIVTKTRGAWVGVIASLVILPFFTKVNMVKVVIMIMVVLAVIAPLALQNTTIAHIITKASILDRDVMWKNGWKIYSKHPIIGNGVNTFFENYKRIRTDEFKDKRGSYAHNCYLQMASEIGAVGLALFLAFIASLLYSVKRSLKRIRGSPDLWLLLGITLGVIAFLVHSAFDTNLYSLNLSYLFWMALGAAVAMTNINCDSYEKDTCN